MRASATPSRTRSPARRARAQEAFSLSAGALKVAQNIVEVRLRLVDGHQNAGIPCVAEMARRFQGLVIEGNRPRGWRKPVPPFPLP